MPQYTCRKCGKVFDGTLRGGQIFNRYAEGQTHEAKEFIVVCPYCQHRHVVVVPIPDKPDSADA